MFQKLCFDHKITHWHYTFVWL